MPRRYRKRKKFLKLRLKPQTITTLFAVFLIGLSFITILSFFQSGSILDSIRLYINESFGAVSILLPAIIFPFALLFLPFKTSLVKFNIPFGALLSYLCLVALSRSGTFGEFVWQNFENSLSPIGAFIAISLMLFIGLIVFFNTSFDEIAGFLYLLKKPFARLYHDFIKKTEQKTFVEKIKIKSHEDEFKGKEEQKRDSLKIEEKLQMMKKSKQSTSQASLISQTVIANTSTTNQVWEYPPVNILSTSSGQKADRGDIKQNAQTIEKTLESFGIRATIVEINLGPAVTQYALEITLGTKLSKITALASDLALALAAPHGQIRIEAPIPGRSLVGIEIPNRTLEFVTLKHMLSSDAMKRSKDKLLVALGLDVSGNPITANLSKMPHVLIAGTTGSGKSVLINSWISSLLYRTTPAEVRLILVDPKRVELTGYNSIPHLLTPVIVEPEKILSALKWATQEMDRRYKIFAEVGVRNIDSYNELSGFQAIPYIAIFIDELADLMAYAPVEIEEAICRLAQMARATGIHLVVATQRPSVDVITGLIKANIPSRIAFNVSSMIDSRVIIDMPGAEKLLGRGDMLYIPPDQAKPTRIQGTYVSEWEVGKLVEFLRNKNVPVEYTQEVTTLQVPLKRTQGAIQTSYEGRDTLFENAVRVVCQYDRASASLLQRRLSIGYARAARILDQLENEGVVSPGEGSKPRDVLVRNPEEFFASAQTTQDLQKNQ